MHLIGSDILYGLLEYRQFCEENLCGNFNVISSCPPACGTPEEMHRKALNYKKALILQTVLESPEEQFDVKKAKYNHNILTEKLYKKMEADAETTPLLISAGPYKRFSCMGESYFSQLPPVLLFFYLNPFSRFSRPVYTVRPPEDGFLSAPGEPHCISLQQGSLILLH